MSSEDVNEKIARNRNMLYYDQLLKNHPKSGQSSRESSRKKAQQNRKKVSFASKKVDIKDFFPAPEGWEFFAYSLYAIAIPYVLGAVFLFFAVAGASFSNFMLLNMSTFIVVWLIGYEIFAVIMLIWILKLYLEYDDQEKYY